MRTTAILLVAGVTLLGAGCGKQAPDSKAAAAVPSQAPRADAPTQSQIDAMHAKYGKCIAAVEAKHESAQQGEKDEDRLCNKYLSGDPGAQ